MCKRMKKTVYMKYLSHVCTQIYNGDVSSDRSQVYRLFGRGFRIYCSLIQPVLEYGAPVWSVLPGYLSNVIKSVQRRALRIICSLVEYEAAFISTGLVSLDARRANLSAKFFSEAKETPPKKDDLLSLWSLKLAMVTH